MKNSNVYLEVSDNTVSLLEGKSNKKGVTVSRWKEEEFDSFNHTELKQAVSLLFTKKKKTNINLLLSNSHLLMKTVEIPTLKEKDIQSLIENNLSQYFTLGSEKYVASFKVLKAFSKDGKDMLELLLIAYPKQELDMILRACEDNCLTVQTIEPYSNVVFQEYAGTKHSIAIVDIQENKGNCVIIRENHLFLHATFDPNEADSFSFSDSTREEVILSNLRGYLNFYASKNYGENIEKILLFSSEEGLKEEIQDKTSIPVQLNDLPYQISFKKNAEIVEGKYSLGLFFFVRNIQKNSTINLLNHSFYQKKKENHTLMIAAILIISLLMAHSIASPFYEKSQLEDRIANYKEEAFRSDQTVADLKVFNSLSKERVQKEKALKDLRGNQFDFPLLVSIVYSLLPEKVTVEQFVVKESGVISVQFGVNGTLSTSKLTNALNDSGYFEKIYLENVGLDDRKEILQLDLLLLEDQKPRFLLGGEEIE